MDYSIFYSEVKKMMNNVIIICNVKVFMEYCNVYLLICIENYCMLSVSIQDKRVHQLYNEHSGLKVTVKNLLLSRKKKITIFKQYPQIC